MHLQGPTQRRRGPSGQFLQLSVYILGVPPTGFRHSKPRSRQPSDCDCDWVYIVSLIDYLGAERRQRKKETASEHTEDVIGSAA